MHYEISEIDILLNLNMTNSQYDNDSNYLCTSVCTTVMHVRLCHVHWITCINWVDTCTDHMIVNLRGSHVTANHYVLIT